MDSPLNELVLRRYEKPNKSQNRREIARLACLSLGLLQPGDSRDVVVDILIALLEARAEKKALSVGEIKSIVVSSRSLAGLSVKGVAESNIRRQLGRLKSLLLVEKVGNRYQIAENENLETLFTHRVEAFLIPSTVARVKEYLRTLEACFLRRCRSTS